MQFLRANTQVKVVIGPVVAVANGYVPVTTLDLSTADEAELLKHDAGSVTDIAAATFAAITSADGYYNLTLTTSHTDTEGLLTVLINDDSLCLPVKQTFMVLAEAAYDSLFVAKDDGFMDVNIKTIGRADTQETEASNLETACANYSATRGLSGTALPAAAADAAGGLPISDAGGLDLDTQLGKLVGTIASGTHNPQSGDAYAIVNSGTHGNAALKTLIDAVGGYVDTEVAAIVSELAKVPKSDSNVTWNATALASIQSECNDALVAYDPPTKAELDTAVANVSVEEIQATAIADLFNTDSGTTYASAVAGSAVKEIAGNAGGASLTVQDIVDGVWDEARSQHVSAGTFGEYVLADATRISGSSTAADNAEVVFATDFATNYDTTNDRWSVGVAALAANVITATSINTAAFTAANFANGAFSGAWEFDLDSVMFGAGTAGSYMKDLPNTSEFEARTLVAASYATAANQVTIAGYLDTEIAAILADVVAIKAKTDNLPASPAATGDIPSASSIATAVLTTAMTESYAAQGATMTLAQFAYIVHQGLFDSSRSGTTWTLKKLDQSTTAATATYDDATNPTAVERAT